MERIEWDEAMSVGCVALDRQHRTLFSLYNDLVDRLGGLGADNTQPSSAEILEKLIDYINVHFEYEEDLLSAAGYPDLALHQDQHETFIKKVLAAQATLSADFISDQWQDFGSFLGHWLLGHVMVVDKLYSSCLERAALPVSG